MIFEADRSRWKGFDLALPQVVYHSKEGWSGAIDVPISFRHSIFSFGLVDTADELLERNAGIRLRYENKKVGSDRVQLRINFDS